METGIYIGLAFYFLVVIGILTYLYLPEKEKIIKEEYSEEKNLELQIWEALLEGLEERKKLRERNSIKYLSKIKKEQLN